MDRLHVELSALGFQALVTALLGLVYLGLWGQQRRAYFATWAVAWGFYALRLGLISAYITTRHDAWLFAHQVATGLTALLLLFAALQFSRGVRWRRRYLWLGLLPLAWAWFSVFVIHNMVVGGISSAVVISAVTLWTGWVFFQHGRRDPSPGATVLAWTFTLWGIHHLDYPLLRPLGSGVLFGVFADVLFIVAVAVGTLFLVLNAGRRALEGRSAQLEQLTQLLLRTQEDERRRIARELHDEAGQILTAAKIELDLEGRTKAAAMVGRALAQVRDLSNLLRPAALDDLGLVPALRGLVQDFAERSRVAATLEAPEAFPAVAADLQVVLYRVVQEALTNVARHAAAKQVRVGLAAQNGRVRLVVEDDGRGVSGAPVSHLGLLGMRERVTAAGGQLSVAGSPGGGFRVEADLPWESQA